MSFFHQSSHVNASGSNFNAVGGNQINITQPAASDMNDLLKFCVPNASYSRAGSVARCLPGTRENVIAKIIEWAERDARPICWMSGPAGSGKSAIAQTVAERYASVGRLAASFFFFRGEGARSDTTHFFPTLAYQLAISLPATKTSIQTTVRSDPTIPHQSFERQFQELVIKPVLPLAPTISLPHVVVVDGLDECDNRGSIAELIRTIIDAFGRYPLPFRFLFSSRAEEHIRQAFDAQGPFLRTQFFPLQDFNPNTDIRAFFRTEFDAIYRENYRVMRYVPQPWPSDRDLDWLVEQSSDLFIFAATLVKFVGNARDRNDLPHEKLQIALNSHHGLDPLYKQVLEAAPQSSRLMSILGIIILLFSPLSVTDLTQLLQLDPADIVHPLLDLQSILMVPEDDHEPIHLFHASLRDFLTDQERSGGLFIKPPTFHITIVLQCLSLIMTHLEIDKFGEGVLKYACLNWWKHLESAIANGSIDNTLDQQLCIIMDQFRIASPSFLSWVNTLILEREMVEVLECLNRVGRRLQQNSNSRQLQSTIYSIQNHVRMVCSNVWYLKFKH